MTKINEKNYKSIIDGYNRAVPQEYHKSEILLDKFNLFMGGGPIGSLENKSDASGGVKYAEYEREDRELNERIRVLNQQLVT